MSDLKAQAATQLHNIEAATGRTAAEFTALVKAAGLEKHGKMVAWFKAEHGLTHGNANLMAHTVRERLAGGPVAAEDLLAAQYAGKKAHLMAIYERVMGAATGLGEDVEVVVQKTGVSLRRKKQFALVQAPSSKRVQLGLNLADTPEDPRVKAVKGMCSHRVELTTAEAVDEDVASWLRASYERAG